MRLLSCVFVLAAVVVSGCGGGDSDTPTSPSAAPSLNVAFSTTDLRVGTGTEISNGRQVVLHYTGWIYSPTATDNKGQQFDSSRSAGRTALSFVFPGNFIQGFNMGMSGMRPGGLRRVVIPPNLAYGNTSPGSPIRANETLLFELEAVSVQ